LLSGYNDVTIQQLAQTPLQYSGIRSTLHSYLRDSPMQTWYLQVQDSEYNVLLLNQEIGNYKKYNKWMEKKIDEIIFRQYPTAKRWEVRTNPYTSRVVM
jgi:hypothetical protein